MIWFVIAICCLTSFTFSGIEAGILSVNRVRLRHRVKLRDKAAIKLNRLLSRPERLLVTVLIVTNLMNIFAVTLTTGKLVQLLGREGYMAAFLVCLPLYLFAFELLPKSLFRRFPYRALAALSALLSFIDLLLSPILKIGDWFGQSFLDDPDKKKLFVAREDFKYFTIESERTGTLTKLERDMIHNIVDYRMVTARQLMVPLSKTPSINANASVNEFLAMSKKNNIDRVPVVSETGKVIGLVSAFEVLLDRPVDGGGKNFPPLADAPVEPYVRRIVTVAADELAFNVIFKLRAARARVASVLDANAETIGVITFEDLIKRLLSMGTPAV